MAANHSSSAGAIPRVPVSPLVKALIEAERAHVEAAEKLAQAKQNQSVPLGEEQLDSLRRWGEDFKVQRRRMETCEHDMESVAMATALNWEPNVLARQVAAIDCQLFQRVVLDKRLQNVAALHDFGRYLTHSLAHQLIFYSELTPASSVVPPFTQHHHLVTHWLRVAYLLVHVYRDFAGFAAVMAALSLPEVRRLHSLWRSCPARSKDMYSELLGLVSEADDYRAYRTWLADTIDWFQQHAPRPATLAIPWLRPHFASIRSIVNTHTNDDAAATHKLADVIEPLSTCQKGIQRPPPGLDNSRPRVSLPEVQLEGLRSPVVPPTDLSGLAPGEPIVYHWLVSRAYLDKQQLVQESTELKALEPAESLSTHEDNDMLDDALLQRLTLPPSMAATPKKSRLSPTAPEFVPTRPTVGPTTPNQDDDPNEQWLGYNEHKRKTTIAPSAASDDDETWTGYPGYPSPVSSQSLADDEEWKGYMAYKELDRKQSCGVSPQPNPNLIQA